MRAFDALRQVLAGISSDPYTDAQRIEQALHAAGFALLPVPEPAASHIHAEYSDGKADLMLTGLGAVQTDDARDVLWRMKSRREAA